MELHTCMRPQAEAAVRSVVADRWRDVDSVADGIELIASYYPEVLTPVSQRTIIRLFVEVRRREVGAEP